MARKRRLKSVLAPYIGRPGPEPAEVLRALMLYHAEHNNLEATGRYAEALAPYRHPRMQALAVGQGSLFPDPESAPADIARAAPAFVIQWADGSMQPAAEPVIEGQARDVGGEQ
jgi:hypothetical protein